MSLLFLLLISACGCGGAGGSHAEHTPAAGTVTVGDQPATAGEVRFVTLNPRDGLPERTFRCPVQEDGSWQFDSGGGLPPGEYRVEVEATRRTGRQVEQFIGTESTLVDETERISPEEYAGSSSPLRYTSPGDHLEISLPLAE